MAALPRCFLVALLLVAGVLLQASAAPPGEGEPLPAGESRGRAIDGQERQVYRIAVTAGSPLLVTIDQQGIDLAVEDGIPGEPAAVTVNAPNGRWGPETLVLTAAGEHLGAWAAILRFLHDFLVGEYGLITMAISYALAIVLPIVTTFFLVFSLLEDSGYLPRMSILVNRVFRLMGLNGKAVLPMILGLGCDTMATMTTRILETRKERVVTTMLLALAVPCSAQLGVLLAMMASLSPLAGLAWAAMMIGITLLVGWLTARSFPGEAGDFILEIPPMRRPQLANVWRKTLGRLNWYLREVIPLFAIGTAALFLLDRLRVLGAIARLGEPLVTGWLGLPKETSSAFLIGFLRRDFGAVYLLDAATGPHPLLSPHQIFVAMITITLFMPCVANFLMIGKEHGFKVAWGMAGFIFPFAFLTGGLIHHVHLWLTRF
ncbi:MAG TPA: nucleoside recognition domain-containing protein [Thermoanaerobaculia bacterium]|jgi:ferrous iron transport protein B|nr:nucleoside recognition domain-containing protein [Thermoanaerobaculia bacterium]